MLSLQATIKFYQKLNFIKSDISDSDVMSKAISLCENLLEQQQRRDRQTQKQCEAEKVLLTDKRRELEQIQNQIETILNQGSR